MANPSESGTRRKIEARLKREFHLPTPERADMASLGEEETYDEDADKKDVACAVLATFGPKNTL